MGGAMTSRGAERRRHLRRSGADLGWVRAARLGPGLDAVLTDLSRGGARLETATRLRPGMKTVLRLSTADGELRASGEVVRAWVSALPPGRGVLYEGALRFDRAMALPDAIDLRPPGQVKAR